MRSKTVIKFFILSLACSCENWGVETSKSAADTVPPNRIESGAYMQFIAKINACLKQYRDTQTIQRLNLGGQATDCDTMAKYCANFTTTLEHPNIRRCKYLAFEEKCAGVISLCAQEVKRLQEDINLKIKSLCEGINKNPGLREKYDDLQPIVQQIPENVCKVKKP